MYEINIRFDLICIWTNAVYKTHDENEAFSHLNLFDEICENKIKSDITTNRRGFLMVCNYLFNIKANYAINYWNKIKHRAMKSRIRHIGID